MRLTPTVRIIRRLIYACRTFDACRIYHPSLQRSPPSYLGVPRAKDFPRPISEQGASTTRSITCTCTSYAKSDLYNPPSLSSRTSKASLKPRADSSSWLFSPSYANLAIAFVTKFLRPRTTASHNVDHVCLSSAPEQVSLHSRPPTTTKPTTVSDALHDLPDLANGAAIPSIRYRSIPLSEYSRRLRGNCQMCTNNFVTRNARYVIDRYKHIPPGGNWRYIPDHLMTNYTDRTRCHDGIYHRLTWNSPSTVIGNYRKNMLIHPSADRGLSVREAARIQSFPDSYIFTGSIGFQQQQVANAVPPMLAQAVFEELQ